MFLGEEDQPGVETGQACSFAGWISLAGAYLRSGSVNREGLGGVGSCLGIDGMLLKFEEKCIWEEQSGKMSRGQQEEKICMVTRAA